MSMVDRRASPWEGVWAPVAWSGHHRTSPYKHRIDIDGSNNVSLVRSRGWLSCCAPACTSRHITRVDTVSVCKCACVVWGDGHEDVRETMSQVIRVQRGGDTELSTSSFTLAMNDIPHCVSF